MTQHLSPAELSQIRADRGNGMSLQQIRQKLQRKRGDRALFHLGLFYLWTVCSNEAGYKQPAEVGKIGLYQALGRAFKHVFSNPEDANHNGPEYGKVVQEGGHLTAQSDHEKIRTCMALRLLLVIISGKLSKSTSASTRRSRPLFLDFLVFWLWVSYILIVCS
jgi:hypothetical protein